MNIEAKRWASIFQCANLIGSDLESIFTPLVIGTIVRKCSDRRRMPAWSVMPRRLKSMSLTPVARKVYIASEAEIIVMVIFKAVWLAIEGARRPLMRRLFDV